MQNEKMLVKKTNFVEIFIRFAMPVLLFLSLFGVMFFILVDNNEDVVRVISCQLIIFVFAILWFVRMLKDKNYRFNKNNLNIPIIAFIAAALISLIKAVNPYQGFAELSMLAIYALMFFAIVNNVDEEKTVNIFVYSLLILTAVVSLHGIFQYLRLDFLWFMFPAGSAGSRVGSVFGNADFLGGYLAMVFPICFSMFIFRKKKILFGILSLIIFTCLLLTFTRSAWISFGVSLAYLLLIFFKDKREVFDKNKKYLLFGLIGAGAIFFIANFAVSNQIVQRIGAIFNMGDRNVQVRFDLWRTAVSFFRKSPYIGIGYDNFKIVAQGCRIHNEYLQILAEMGSLGIGVFSWFILSFFDLAAKKTKEETVPYRQVLLMSFRASIVAMLIDSIFAFPMHRLSHNILFWGILAMTVVLGKMQVTGQKETLQKKVKVQGVNSAKTTGIAAIVISFICIFFLLRSFLAVFYYNRGFEANRFADKSPEMREQTKQLFMKAAKLAPFNYQIQHDWAIVVIQTKDLEAGEKAFQWSEKLYPNKLADVRLELGLLYYEKGNYAKAEGLWQETIDKFPNSSRAFFYLGGLYANQNKIEQAIRYCQAAINYEPNNIDYLKALAKIYYRDNDTKRAVETIKEVLKIAPQDQEANAMYQVLKGN